MSIAPFVLVLFQAVTAYPSIPEDSAEALRRAARSAERSYERLVRRLAPVRFGGGAGGPCDEVVGRFCLIYDGGKGPPPDSVAPQVLRARQDVVDALRRAFAGRPGDLSTAGPLLRYLVEDGRADEAVSAARTFAWASADSVWGPLLLGYALHAAGDDSAAERQFDEALARMPARERRRFETLDVLLAGKERGVYGDLAGGERAAYEERFWRLGDPLYLLAGNERRAEHFARHVWSRLLSEAPVVRGMTSWGRDLEELTLRYGVPASRERIVNLYALAEDSYVEHYHPDALAFLPESLRTAGFPAAPPPGEPWPLERERARSGYAPSRVRRMVPLAHQVARFPAGDSVAVMVYGRMPLDPAAAGRAAARAGLFLLGAAYGPVREERAVARAARDTVEAVFEVRVRPGAYVYSFEVLEEETRLAGRSRYALDVPGYPSSGVALSDPVLADAFGAGALPAGRRDGRLRPRAEPVLTAGDTVGVYAEAHGLAPGPDSETRYAVEVVLRRVEDRAALSRALRWLGRRLGLAGEREPPRLRWDGRAEAGLPAILAFDVPLVGLAAGLYELELTVEDRVGGSSSTSRRLFRIREGGG